MNIYKNKSFICLILGFFILGFASPANTFAQQEGGNTLSKKFLTQVTTCFLPSYESQKRDSKMSQFEVHVIPNSAVNYDVRWLPPFTAKRVENNALMIHIKNKYVHIVISDFSCNNPQYGSMYSSAGIMWNVCRLPFHTLAIGMGCIERITAQPVRDKVIEVIKDRYGNIVPDTSRANLFNGFNVSHDPALFFNLECLLLKNFLSGDLVVGVQLVSRIFLDTDPRVITRPEKCFFYFTWRPLLSLNLGF